MKARRIFQGDRREDLFADPTVRKPTRPRHPSDKAVECPTCNKHFSGNYSLARHQRNVHQSEVKERRVSSKKAAVICSSSAVAIPRHRPPSTTTAKAVAKEWKALVATPQVQKDRCQHDPVSETEAAVNELLRVEPGLTWSPAPVPKESSGAEVSNDNEYYVSVTDEENDVEPDDGEPPPPPTQSTVPVNVPASLAWNLVALDPRTPSRMEAIDKALQLSGSIVVAAASAFPNSSPSAIATRLAKKWDNPDAAVYVLRRRIADIHEKERQDKARQLGNLIDPADV